MRLKARSRAPRREPLPYLRRRHSPLHRLWISVAAGLRRGGRLRVRKVAARGPRR